MVPNCATHGDLASNCNLLNMVLEVRLDSNYFSVLVPKLENCSSLSILFYKRISLLLRSKCVYFHVNISLIFKNLVFLGSS